MGRTNLGNNQLFRYSLYLFFPCLLSFPSFATEWGVQVKSSMDEFFYREFTEAGSQLNRERGWVPSVSLGLSWQPGGKWSHEIFAKHSSGSVDYDGRTNLGNPFSTQTKQRFRSIRWLTAYSFMAGLPELILQLGTDQWRRDIQPRGFVQGLYEVYRWDQAALGARWTIWQSQGWQLSSQVLGGITWNPKMTVDLSDQGYGVIPLNLSEKPIWQGALQLSKVLSPKVDMQLGMSYQAWQFGGSDIQEVMGPRGIISIREPDSRTSLLGVHISVVGSF